MGVVRYLMLVEETNMVEAIPQAHVYTRSTVHSELNYYSISRQFTLSSLSVQASGVIFVLL